MTTTMFGLLWLVGLTFAQSLPGWQFNSVTTQNNWFANQERISTAYTSNQCLPNEGVYKNMRLYLSDDQNNNGLKDYKPQWSATYHLKDNILYYWNV